VSPENAIAGVTKAIEVTASIPLTGASTSGTVTATVAGTPLSGPLKGNGTVWSGTVGVPLDLSLKAARHASQITVTAQSDLGLLSNGKCPDGTTQSAGFQCLITCDPAPTTTIFWSDDPPNIFVFQATPDKVAQGAPTPVALVWAVKGATSASIDQGVGQVGLVGTTLEFPPDQTTTYTLTATDANGQKVQKTATVTVEKAPLVTLTAPGNNSTIPGTSVGVAGTVQNARPGDVVEMRVNGASRGTVSVSGGAFSTGVALDKTLSLGDLTFSNPNASVTSNGSVNIPVTLGNSKARDATRNEITASVVGVPTSLDAVVVFNTILVDQFKVEWLSCPPLNKDEPLSFELGAGQSVSVGTVSCGVQSGGFWSDLFRTSQREDVPRDGVEHRHLGLQRQALPVTASAAAGPLSGASSAAGATRP